MGGAFQVPTRFTDTPRHQDPPRAMEDWASASLCPLTCRCFSVTCPETGPCPSKIPREVTDLPGSPGRQLRPFLLAGALRSQSPGRIPRGPRTTGTGAESPHRNAVEGEAWGRPTKGESGDHHLKGQPPHECGVPRGRQDHRGDVGRCPGARTHTQSAACVFLCFPLNASLS